MGGLESRHILTRKNKWKPDFWVRVKDDVLTLLRYGRDQVEPFLALHENIEFTCEIENENNGEPGIPFLDMRCVTSGREIKTHVYRKPSNTNRCINFSSHGPPNQKIGVLKSFLYRAHKLCDPEYLEQEKEFLTNVAIIYNGMDPDLADRTVRNY